MNIGCTNIGASWFIGITTVSNVMLLDSVTTIGDNAFKACSALTNLTIGGGVIEIGKFRI